MRQERTVQASIFDVFAGHEIGRELKAMPGWLDAHRALLGLVAEDLRRDGVRATGRQGLPAEAVLRCALLKQHRQLSYEELAFHLEDSASFRAFARLPWAWSPKKSVLQKTIGAIRAGTWEAINRTLLASARQARLEDGSVVRLDSTVTAALMHQPSALDVHLRHRQHHGAHRAAAALQRLRVERRAIMAGGLGNTDGDRAGRRVDAPGLVAVGIALAFGGALVGAGAQEPLPLDLHGNPTSAEPYMSAGASWGAAAASRQRSDQGLLGARQACAGRSGRRPGNSACAIAAAARRRVLIGRWPALSWTTRELNQNGT